MFVDALSVSTEHWTSTAIPQTDLQIAQFFEFLKEEKSNRLCKTAANYKSCPLLNLVLTALH